MNIINIKPITLLTFNFLQILLITLPLHAEVTFDGTLGPRVALPGPDYHIEAQYGQQHGGNLFQSFSDFNINLGESATFSGPDSVNNLISRVTGGNPSTINGAFRSTLPNADVYFLNPAGLLFGPHASLDVQGAFHASTADYLRLGDKGRFDARSPDNSLLSIAPVEDFGFLDNTVGSISVEGRGRITASEYNGETMGLTVPDGKTLSLIGGELTFKKGTFSGTFDEEQGWTDLNRLGSLQAPQGRINLASVASKGEVIPIDLDLEMASFDQLGKISVTENSFVDVSGTKGGSIFIRGEALVFPTSRIHANTLTSQDVEPQDGGLIDIQANQISGIDIEANNSLNEGDINANSGRINIASHQGNLHISDAVLIATSGRINIASVMDSGEMRPTPDDLTLSAPGGTLTVQESIIATGGLSKEKKPSGDIYIRAGQFEFRDSIMSAETDGEKTGGSIDIRAEQLTISKDGNLFPRVGLSIESKGSGDSGDITIVVKDSLDINQGLISVVTANTEDNAGNGGTIDLRAKQLNVSNGSEIAVGTLGPGDGGELKIKVDEAINLSHAHFMSLTIGQMEKAGQGGSISLQAKQLRLSDGSQISASTLGAGNSGDLTIKVDDTVNLSNSVFFLVSNGHMEKAGQGGSISLQAKQLLLSEGSKIYAATAGPGNSGELKIKVDEAINLSNSRFYLISTGKMEKAGQGGSMSLQAKELHLSEGSEIFAATTGPGNSGELKIKVDDAINLSNSRFYLVSYGQMEKAGAGGSMSVQAKQLNMTEGAQIKADTYGPGKAGNISIHIRENVELYNQSAMTSNTENVRGESGDGGLIDLHAKRLILDDDSIISAESGGQGTGGRLNIHITENASISGSSRMLTGARVQKEALFRETVEVSIEKIEASFFKAEEGGYKREFEREVTEFVFRQFSKEIFQAPFSGKASRALIKKISSLDRSRLNTGFNHILRQNVFSETVITETKNEVRESVNEFFGTQPEQSAYALEQLEKVENVFLNVNNSSVLDEAIMTVDRTVNDLTHRLGQAGDLNLHAGTLTLTDGARIGAITEGAGKGGMIDIDVEGLVTIQGENDNGNYSGLFARTYGSGQGGEVQLNANELRLQDGGVISASSFGSGQGGNITLDVNGLIQLEGDDSHGEGSFIGAGTWSQDKTHKAAKGGSVTLKAKDLQIMGGAAIETGTMGEGQGGNININVTGRTSLSGRKSGDGQASRILTDSKGAGNAGTIDLTTGELYLTDNSKISVSTTGTGKGGDLKIQANHFSLNNRSHISATSSGHNASGGTITLTSPGNLYLNNSNLTTSINIKPTGENKKGGTGGDIKLNTKMIVLANGSKIKADAVKGRGGNIDITADGIYNSATPSGSFTPYHEEDYPADDRLITASSELDGMEGVVAINVSDINVVEAMVALPTTFFDANALLETPCSEEVAENSSEFITTYSEGIANAPDDLLPSGLIFSQPMGLKTRSSQTGQYIKGLSSLNFAGLQKNCQPRSSKGQ